MVTTRAARAARAAACAAALSIATATLPAGPAHAADTITAADQPYYAYYHLDQARAKGYTGQGVTIALLDGEVDTTAPELTGATITDKTPCTITSSSASKRHGTAVASILVAPAYGVAPQASVLTYRTAVTKAGDTRGDDCRGTYGADVAGHAALINHAVNDGAQIISISETGTSDIKWAVAHALSNGVVVVAGAGNEGEDVFSTNSLDRWSGVVGVGAITTEGVPTAYSSKGQGVTTAALGGPVLARNYESGQNEPANGTSMATPMVAGFLALARQKWPDATANQLLQLLTKTALNKEGAWNPYTGYGVASLGAMLNTDPSQYPDENPLMDKGGGLAPSPTAEEVQLYADGLVSPSEIKEDSSYVYRGLDESQLKAATNSYPTHIGTSPRYHR